MKLKKKVMYSGILGAGAALVSLVYPLVPCKKIPNVPNPDTSFSWCSLSQTASDSLNTSVSFFGYTESIAVSLLVIFCIAFFGAFFFFHMFNLKHK